MTLKPPKPNIEARLNQWGLKFAITNDQPREPECYGLHVKEKNWTNNEAALNQSMFECKCLRLKISP